jgi:dihydrofolate reductase
MKTIAIVAVSENGVIGVNNDIPWRLKNDLRYFKRTTLGHHILMGRKSYESLGKPLKGRTNLMLSRKKETPFENVHVFSSIADALQWSQSQGEELLFIAGGGQVYKQTVEIWDELYLTRVHAEVKGDVYFPDLDFEEWNLYYSEYFDAGPEDQYPFTIQFYRRKPNT